MSKDKVKIKGKKENLKKQDKTRDEKGKWKKGVSGNPDGRPQGTLSLVALLKKKLEEVPKGEKKSYADMFIDRWVSEALENGDFAALKEAVRYVDGMPKQSVDHTTKGEKLQNITITDLKNKSVDDIRKQLSTDANT